ncbi:MAG: hypothetical protein JNJ98_08590 [Gemmatimonadetes bacterium]|nr:hypothetical protein [Gemmatimonadota bacterium]
MIGLPRYALAPPTFRFRAAMSVADRLPLGGEREVALASWMTARLLWDLGDASSAGERLRAHATAMRQWGQALALPAPARAAFTQVLDAAARGDRAEALAAWQRLLALASRAVDAAFRPERRAIEDRLAPRPDA